MGKIFSLILTLMFSPIFTSGFAQGQSQPPLKQGGQSKNVRLVGHSDLNGKGDGLQIVGQTKDGRSYVYVGHMFSGGLSVVEVTDPAHPRVIKSIPSPPNTWYINLQVADDLLIAASEFNRFLGDPKKPAEAGIRIFHVADPANPKELSFFKTSGPGTHRNWYVGGRYAYLAAGAQGYTDRIFMVVDISDPRHPVEVSRWWLPGMCTACGEKPHWKPEESIAIHGPIIAGDRAYIGWNDAGIIILDISDIKNPKFISRLDWSPPYGGHTHTAFPLRDRGLLIVTDEARRHHCQEPQKLAWVVDIRDDKNPIPISTFPLPEGNFCQKGGRFGPHNVHENRPGSKTSNHLIYITYFNAGLRIVDISNPYRPEEVGYFVPPDPETILDPRRDAARAIQTNDVYVDERGYIYITDYNAGLYVLEFTPAKPA